VAGPRSTKRLISLVADAVAIFVALVMAYALAFQFNVPGNLLHWLGFCAG